MVLNRREMPFEVPSYSLTGDILAFQRCALQYRYYNGSSLPPSRPVQLWTGEFVHGVLEEAYRHWQAHQPPFPWPCNPTPSSNLGNPPSRVNHDLGVLGDIVEARLKAAGKTPRSREARDVAYRRVEAAVNILGPHLFPLITDAERRIQGTRAMPSLPGGGNPARGGADRYELTGVVDVISHMAASANPTNPLVEIVRRVASNTQPPFEIIVDYKSERRPATEDRRGQQHRWQIQTYAWLCSQVPRATPIRAGLLIYLNELAPSKTDLEELKREMASGKTDVVPPNGSADYYALHRWQPAAELPRLSEEFRILRAICPVDVSQQSIQMALQAIDRVVSEIERSAMKENNTGNIPENWKACGEYRDCVACDFRHFCPSPAHRRETDNPKLTPPIAPG